MALKGWGEFHAFALVKQLSPGRGRDQWGPSSSTRGSEGHLAESSQREDGACPKSLCKPEELQIRAIPKHRPSPLPAINQGTTGRFPLGSATKSTRLGSAPTAALNEGKSRAKQWEAWRNAGGVGSTQEGEDRGGWFSPMTGTGRRYKWLFPLLSCTEGQSLKCSNLYIFVCKYSCYSLAMYSAHFTYLCTALWGSNFGGEGK